MKENVAEFLQFRYEKLSLLKQSARGEVWLAKDKSSGGLVIVKCVKSIGLPYDVIKKISFKLPAKVFYCAEDEVDTVVVEEFIQGENLHEREKILSASEAREILLQMCDGLKELHAHNIIHRDIKPSNLILQGGKIRLIDFDAARIFKADKQADTNLLGTKGYAPPEQYGSGQTDSRSDIYSLGVTMKILLGENCSGQLKKILDKCTELDPKNRFQSVDEIKAALTIDEPPRKNFSPLLIFLTTGIFLLAGTPPLNSNENFSEVITPTEDLPIENISTPQEILPVAKSEPFKFPEITLPPSQTQPPNYEPPKRYEPPQQKKFSGLLKTKFYLNGEPFDQFAHMHENIKITRDDWRRTQARLHIINDTGRIWNAPTIKFILNQTAGDKLESTKSLPALNVDAAADFIVPFDLYQLSDRKNSSAYIQIWLEGDESKMDEHYWCVWFDIVD